MDAPCAICRAATATVRFHLADMTVVDCDGCGAVTAREPASGTLVSTEYDDAYFTARPAYQDYLRGDRALRAAAADAVLDIAADARAGRAVAAAGTMLDIGCGAGYLVEQATQRAIGAVGVDRAPAVLARARSVTTAPLVCCARPRDVLPRATFDLITLVDVLEHVTDPIATLDEARHLAHPSTLLVVVVPGFGGWMSEQQGADYYHFGRDHRWYFTSAVLALVLERAGWRDVRCERLADALRRIGPVPSAVWEKYGRRRDHLVATGWVTAGPPPGGRDG